ncbi:MAG: ankyrin repeat domain-containing protein [Sulfuricurvum sp.]|nr:ankyrin repeat domain-containing protein [Sulfuricurvum sp.]
MEQWTILLKANDYLGVKKYLKNGGNPNEVEENGESVLCFAIRYHCDEMLIDLLLENGADIHHVDHEGVSVFDVAVTYNNLSVIEKLINDNFDINQASRKSGFTPLMGAVCYGRVDVIKKLLEMGVDLNARDAYGLSAIDFARKMRKKSILSLLEEETKNGTD